MPTFHLLTGFGTVSGTDPVVSVPSGLSDQYIGEKIFLWSGEYGGTSYGGTYGQDGSRGTKTEDGSFDPESDVRYGIKCTDRKIIIGMMSDFHWLNTYGYNNFYLMELYGGDHDSVFFMYPWATPGNPIEWGLNGAVTDPWPLPLDTTEDVLKFVEICCVASTTASSEDGSIEIRIDGVTVWLQENVNMGFGGVNGVYWDYVSFAPYGKADNYYIVSGDDATFLSTMKTRAVFPTEDVESDFIPSSGSTAAPMVWQTISDGEATYVEGMDVGDKCLFTMETVVPPPGFETVENVQWLVDARRVGYGRRRIAALCRINGVEYQGEGVDICPTGYRYNSNPKFSMSRSPATGERWTVAEINASKFGWIVIE